MHRQLNCGSGVPLGQNTSNWTWGKLYYIIRRYTAMWKNSVEIQFVALFKLKLCSTCLMSFYNSPHQLEIGFLLNSSRMNVDIWAIAGWLVLNIKSQKFVVLLWLFDDLFQTECTRLSWNLQVKAKSFSDWNMVMWNLCG